jgi:hypothetical protein
VIGIAIPMAKRRIVVDNGPLLTWLTISFLNSRDTLKAVRDQILAGIRPDSVISETHQQRLHEMMTQGVLTTPHVISETLKLREHSALGAMQEEFRNYSLKLLTSLSIREIPCPIAEICSEREFRQLICRYGLTDAGLIFIASRYAALLLTDDARLSRDYSAGGGYQIELLDAYLRQID